MKIIEAIQRVQSLYSHGVQSRDSRLTTRHIYSALMSARSTLIQQQLDKNQSVGQWAYQSLRCIELIPSNIHECPCVPSIGCTILRSKHKLPKTIIGLSAGIIRAVTSLDGKQRFDDTTFETAKYLKGNKYTGNKANVLIFNEYLFLTTKQYLKAVTGLGLFSDVIAAYMFPSICDEDCEDCLCVDPLEFNLPIDGRLETALIQIANEELIALFEQTEEDKSSNSSDDTGGTGKMIHQPNQPQ